MERVLFLFNEHRVEKLEIANKLKLKLQCAARHLQAHYISPATQINYTTTHNGREP
jgi:hypothetical protein